MNKQKKGKNERNVKFVKNRKRFNVLFIFLGFLMTTYLKILEIQKSILHLKNREKKRKER